ncbi:glycoside hydrolase family 97 protein [Maribacter sp. 2304DJ31-5]|uniref:glycoside hydrolase family 97 protein n=1 Tax=Maribacter sp. 2304DJ31-5 TaxID=3386273 RepID=UPI0039BCA49B
MSTKFLLFIICLFGIIESKGQDHQITSPEGNIKLKVKFTDKIYYAVDYGNQEVVWYSPISMTLGNGTVLGHRPKMVNSATQSVSNTIETVWGIRKNIKEAYNELKLDFEGNYSLVFRAYDDGVAYRFITRFKKGITIKDEEVGYRFRKNHKLYAHVVGDFQTSFEKPYTRTLLNDLKEKDYVSLPLVVDEGNLKVSLIESDVHDYPGLYLKREDGHDRSYLVGLFPQYPLSFEDGNWGLFGKRVVERAKYIAKTRGTRAFPWRAMVIGEDDVDLADSDMVYKLARPSKINTDWIKPGKVAWDWWNDWNLEGVDFETGVNNRTYEYYIDFAAKNNIEYVILDEGWSDQFDLLLPVPNIDVPHLVKYGEERGVKIILWCIWKVLDRQMTDALDQFKEWGVAGTKVDFIDRDDQLAINFYERIAAESAKRQLLVDYHGASKPTGLHRTYPNVINFEGVKGNEYNKFAKDITPSHNVDIVFTRMLAGPIDYTPGAMNNSTKGNFYINRSNPMSQGTRMHQIGMYVVYYAPLQMLCDSPTQYEKYPDLLQFLSEVPVSWDDTKALSGKIGEYVVIARKKGNDWYIGGLNNWTEREIDIDLSFLDSGNYEATLLLDGINANRIAGDYKVEKKNLTKSNSMKVTMKQGGGFAVVLKKK